MMTKRKITAGLAAAVLAAGIVAQTSAPANAFVLLPLHPHHHHHHGWGGPLAAGAAGVMIGAALASSASRAPAPAPEYYGLHVRRCMARYRTYDPSTDTFIGYDRRAHYCRL
jgi:hypothetical protein